MKYVTTNELARLFTEANEIYTSAEVATALAHIMFQIVKTEDIFPEDESHLFNPDMQTA